MAKRIKSDLRLPSEVHEALGEISRALGINRNSLVTLAVCRFCAGTLPSLPTLRMGDRAEKLQKRIQTMLDAHDAGEPEINV